MQRGHLPDRTTPVKNGLKFEGLLSDSREEFTDTGSGGTGGRGNDQGNGGSGWGSWYGGPDNSQEGPRSIALLALGAVCSLNTAAPAKADSKSDVESWLDSFFDNAMPYAQQLGMSGIMGFISAYALKTVGKALAVVVGLAFMGLQYLSFKGLITIHWGNMEEKAKAMLDFDNSGKVDSADLKIMYKEALNVLSKGLPDVAGFYLGFMLGLKF